MGQASIEKVKQAQ